MRIVIDLQGAQTESRFRGIGRYSLSLTKSIIRNRGDHDVIIVLSSLFPDTIEPIRSEFNELLPQENIRIWYAPTFAKNHTVASTWQHETAELLREAFIASLQPDIVHIMSLFEGYLDDAITSIGRFDKTTPVSVSLHDLIPLYSPDHYLKPHPVYEQFYLKKIEHLKRSSLLLAISESSRQEGLSFLELPGELIINTSEAADDIFCSQQPDEEENKALRDKLNIPRPFILYSGGSDARKNLPRLIAAYAMLPTELRHSHQLVLTGKMPEGDVSQLQKKASNAGLQADEIVFTGYVSDNELAKLYNSCELYVFPSWHEGFGLPALEAMSCGAAVIGANTSSLPEVIGNTEALFDPYSEEAISSKIASVLSNDELRQSLCDKGLEQAGKFTWEKSAKAAISAFEKLTANTKKQGNRLIATHTITNQIAETVPKSISEEELISLSYAVSLNHPRTGLKQLFVDVSELSQHDAATGVQRVTRSILMELLNNPPQGYRVEPVYATRDCDSYHYARKYTARLLGKPDKSFSDDPIMASNGDVFLGLDLQHHVVTSKADYLKKTHKQGVSLFFLVHDLLPITLKNYFTNGADKLHEQWLEVITRFDGIICVSQTTQKELREWLSTHYPERLNKLNLAYSYNGADIENSRPSKGLPDNYMSILNTLESSYSFLMVGTLEPRKGQQQALLAFEKLWSQGKDIKLVLVGQPGWMTDDLISKIKNQPELNKNLFWLNGISDEYLEKIYASSTCLIAASEGEGFGLPLIEAAQHNLPIIARDIPVFHEITCEHACFFKGEKATSLVSTIEGWITLHKKNEHPKSGSIPWVSWKQSADRLVEIVLGAEEKIPDKQLFLDISELVQRDVKTGIQRVVRSLLKEMLTCSIQGVVVEPVYATKNEGYRYARSFTSKFMDNHETPHLEDELIEYRNGDIFFGLDLEPYITVTQSGFLQHLRNHGVKVIFLVHDLLAIEHPEWFPPGSSEGMTQWLNVICQADGAICVSQTTASDLQKWIDTSNIIRSRPFSISVSHNGADIENSSPSTGLPDDAKVILQHVKKRTSFLVVGTIEPRKGHSQTLDAFEELWDKNIDANLIIVGKQGWLARTLTERIRAHDELNKRLFWLEGISDEYLEKIYDTASCIIVASEGEGFGLPLIEAAQHGLPIIARDIPVFREVAGEHAFYFSGHEPRDMSESIREWISLLSDNKAPSSKQMKWLTWHESAKHLIQILTTQKAVPTRGK